MGFSPSAVTTMYLCRLMFLLVSLFIAGCGGGSSNSHSSNKASFSLGSSQLSVVASSSPSANFTSPRSSSSSSARVPISGVVTYDFVPHTTNGLNYAATVARPARGVLVELLDESNQVLATTATNHEGKYSLDATRDKLVKIRVKAQLLNQSPGWNFKVTDNTQGNTLYAMGGSLIAATEATGIRDLHASSGWGGSSYTGPRVAAPFAILDSIYIGVERIQSTGQQGSYPALELRWSDKNKTAEGQLSLGEIGTSFFQGDAIYILGDENNDTDEYDRHVILHEWGHYVETNFSRSDSIGGDHTPDEKLDMRVAMSEGFANAFSAMILDDPEYRDSSGPAQADGFFYNVSQKNNYERGWYSEASVQSVIYNFYTSSNGKVAGNFADIFHIINADNYVGSNALISIYVFADQLRKNMPAQTLPFNSLLNEQNIEVTDEYGSGESNSGGYTGNLPIYKNLSLNNVAVRACSTNIFGSYNKLGNAQHFLINIAASGNYQFTAREMGEDSGNANPDLYLYRSGYLIGMAENIDVGQENISRFLTAGIYTLELVDGRVVDVDETSQITACFDVQAHPIN